MAETTKRPNGVRSYIADTLALLMFFTKTGIINARFIVGTI